MPRRFPLLPVTLAAAVGLFALTSALTAQPPAAPGDGIKRTEEENLKLYKRFADELLKLAQRWEKSDSPDEKARAKTLRAALDIAAKNGIENTFKNLLTRIPGTRSSPEVEALLAQDRALIKALEEVLETLDTEDETERLRREIEDLRRLIAEVTKLKREEETIRGLTNGRSDPERIAKAQAELARRTQQLAERMNKADPKAAQPTPKDGPPSDKDDAAEPKGEPKPGDNGAEPKPDTKDPKSDGKESAGGEPKPGSEAKPSPKDGMPPDGGGDKPAPKDPAGDPKAAKGTGEPKPVSGGDPKPGDAKPSDGKAQGDGKGEPKPSQGQGGEAKPMPGGSPPADSPPSGSKGSPSAGKPGGGKPGAPKPPDPNNPNDDARRHVEEAVPPQDEAEKDLRRNDREKAGKNEDEAIRKLTEALRELEKRLKQLREKEMLKKLEDLERRVAKMLRMQTEVYETTKLIAGTVKKNSNEMSPADRQKSQVEGDKEGLIGEEAEKALRLLEGEGTAVVFAGVLLEARKDMDAVQKQLTLANVGPDTQLVEEQIIEQLKRMLEALKKANRTWRTSRPPPPGQPPPPNDGKKNLIQLVEQLKLLKDLQLLVNQRTTAFGTRTPSEQASDPFIQEQLRQLGDRQKVLGDMLHKIAAQMTQQ